MTQAVSVAQGGSFNQTMRNRIINGNMVIDQRNAGASVTANQSVYFVDRWVTLATQTAKATVQQSTTAPAGFGNSFVYTSSSAYSVLSTDYFGFAQQIEGNNMIDFAWGTASASTVTLSFWVRSSLTGTFGGSLRNNAGDRSYPFTYAINSANTWEQKSITIAGDTSGSWPLTNGIGIRLLFNMGSGSSHLGTAGAWAAANYLGATGQSSVVGTSGATFYITGVQLEAGSAATPFEYRPYGMELALCQRYYIEAGIRNSGGSDIVTGTRWTTNQIATSFNTPATMRATPTATLSGSYYAYAGGSTYTISSIASVATVTNTGVAIVYTLSSDPSAQAYVIIGGTSSTKTALSAEL